MNINLIFNYIGQSYTALITILFLPAIASILGPEQYGVWGFYLTLSAWLLFLEMGITPAVGRQISSLNYVKNSNEIKSLVKSSEVFLLFIGVMITVIGLFSVSYIANDWLNPKNLSTDYIKDILEVIFFIIFITFFENLYRSCLFAIEKHVSLNLVMISIISLRVVGGYILLKLGLIDFYEYVLLHLIASILSCMILMFLVYKNLKLNLFSINFSFNSIIKIKNFAGGVFLISLAGSIISQIDKIILSGLVSLENFGIYAFSSAFALGALKLVSPITQTFYPKFVGLFTINAKDQLIEYFHFCSQLVILIFGSATICIFFTSHDLIFALSGDAKLSKDSAEIIKILIFGTLISGILSTPYHMQLAHNALRVPIYANVLGVIFIIPVVYFLAIEYGIYGVAFSWIFLNLCYLFISMPIAFRYVLPEEKLRWYFFDNLIPIAMLFLFSYSLNEFLPHTNIRSLIVLRVLAIFILSSLAIIFFLPYVKKELKILYLYNIKKVGTNVK